MIRYALQCDKGHEFEGWFGGSDDYDAQISKGLLTCPTCGSGHIEKAIMAPSVRRADRSAKIAEAIREEIASQCVDVGDNFSDEARAMYYGEKPSRGIYGQATPDDVKSLAEDGIPALPLPDAFHPKRSKKHLN